MPLIYLNKQTILTALWSTFAKSPCAAQFITAKISKTFSFNFKKLLTCKTPASPIIAYYFFDMLSVLYTPRPCIPFICLESRVTYTLPVGYDNATFSHTLAGNLELLSIKRTGLNQVTDPFCLLLDQKIYHVLIWLSVWIHTFLKYLYTGHVTQKKDAILPKHQILIWKQLKLISVLVPYSQQWSVIQNIFRHTYAWTSNLKISRWNLAMFCYKIFKFTPPGKMPQNQNTQIKTTSFVACFIIGLSCFLGER